MDGGITPVAKPIDKFFGGLCKGNYKNNYYVYILTDNLTSKGHQIAPSCQLCFIWVVGS